MPHNLQKWQLRLCDTLNQFMMMRSAVSNPVPMPKTPARPTNAVAAPGPVDSLIHVIRGQKVNAGCGPGVAVRCAHQATQ